MNSQSPETAKCYAQSIPFLYINRRTILGHDAYPYVLLPWSLPGIGAVPMGALLQAWDETPDNFSIRDESGTIFWIYRCYENSDGIWNCLGQSTAGEEIEQTVNDIQEIVQTILRFSPQYCRQKESMLQNADFEHCMALLKSELNLYYLNDEEFDRLCRLLPDITEISNTEQWISLKMLHFQEYIRIMAERHQEFSISPDFFRIFLTQALSRNCTVIRFSKNRHLCLISDRWIGIDLLPLEVTAAQEEFMRQLGRLVLPGIIQECKSTLQNIPIFQLPKERWVFCCGTWFDQSIWRFLDPITVWPAAINDLTTKWNKSKLPIDDNIIIDEVPDDEFPAELSENKPAANNPRGLGSLSNEEIDLRIDRILDMFGMNDDSDK